MIKELVDLSTTIQNLITPVYPGDPPPLKCRYQTIAAHGYDTDVWVLGDHTGTHVDAPSHFIEGGHPIDQVPLSTCVGNGIVLDFSKKPPRYSITKEDIVEALKTKGKENIGPGWIVLFYTGYIISKAGSPQWMEHPDLSEEACRYLASKRISAIGTDALSPDRDSFPVHHLLLPENISIFENLNNLEEVLHKDFIFVGAPLPLVGSSGSPVRAFAIVL